MMDGVMQTCYCVLKEVIDKLQEQSTRLDSLPEKIDKLIEIVQQHAANFSQNYTIFEGIQKNLADMNLRVTCLEKQQALLPTPMATSTVITPSSTASASSAHPPKSNDVFPPPLTGNAIPIQPTKELEVTVGDGNTLGCSGICK
ncbi:hypothetical protein Scep_001392 [Stephania cephalantha]|uniref:Uncharacterized protein n=1 Tax=Stephania cephalantha TaxID=152367 RepID=A0AAP0L8B2_9MAGN